MHFNLHDGVLGKLNHHYFGWVEDAQGFVFISGLVAGAAYGRLRDRRGPEAATRALRARARLLHGRQAALILAALAAAVMLPGAAPLLDPYRGESGPFLLASMLMLGGSKHMGILPMYFWFLLATPFALRLLDEGRERLYAAIVVGLWVAAQFGALDALSMAVEGRIRATAGVDPRLGIYFDVLGWQLLFFGGLWIGWRIRNAPPDLSALASPHARRLFFLCVAAIVALGVFDRMVFWGFFAPDATRAIMVWADRRDLSPLHAFAFAVDLYAVVWLMARGPSDRLAILRRLGALAWRVFTAPPLVLLGRWSLFVFTVHMVIAYAIEIASEGVALGPLAANAVLVGGVLALWGAAWARERVAERQDRGVGAAA